MSIGSISDVLTRISGIEQQLQSLQSGTLLDSALGVSGGSSTSSGSSTTSSDSSSSTDFADQLAAAEQGDSSATSSDGTSDTSDAATSDAATSDAATSDAASTLGDTASASGTSFGSLASSALGTNSYSSGLLSGSSTAGVALSSSATSQLTSGQQQFASTLSADTGLNPNVVGSWLLAEESGGAAQSRQSANNNDWLNIGYTDSATYGASDPIWSDPTSAANATAAWLKGQNSIPGYGTASSGIQSILATVGQTPAAQIQAIQSSGWSSGGYPSLGSLYNQVAG